MPILAENRNLTEIAFLFSSVLSSDSVSWTHRIIIIIALLSHNYRPWHACSEWKNLNNPTLSWRFELSFRPDNRNKKKQNIIYPYNHYIGNSTGQASRRPWPDLMLTEYNITGLIEFKIKNLKNVFKVLFIIWPVLIKPFAYYYYYYSVHQRSNNRMDNFFVYALAYTYFRSVAARERIVYYNNNSSRTT